MDGASEFASTRRSVAAVAKGAAPPQIIGTMLVAFGSPETVASKFEPTCWPPR